MENTQAAPIDVAYPESSSLHLKLSVGGCRLKVAPGSAAWVTGAYYDPSGVLPHRIEREGGMVKITQEYRSADWLNLLGGVTPRFDLALGAAKPYALTLEVGASECSFDLGGLPLSRLLIKQGAGKVGFDFSAPNPEAMSLLSLDSGAVGMEMKNLANANFAEMSVNGGAASYKFDFGGSLQRDGHVRITTGMASVEIIVPATTAAKITTESVLGGVNVGDGFTKKEGAFWTEAALAGKTPVLTIHANVTMGALHLHAI
jgi:hypothetical protein